MLCTLLLPDEGTCRINGHDVATRQRQVRRSIGVSKEHVNAGRRPDLYLLPEESG